MAVIWVALRWQRDWVITGCARKFCYVAVLLITLPPIVQDNGYSAGAAGGAAARLCLRTGVLDVPPAGLQREDSAHGVHRDRCTAKFRKLHCQFQAAALDEHRQCNFTMSFTSAVVRCAAIVCATAGMQSAALGFMLAQAHFADALVAVPSAVSVVFMVSLCAGTPQRQLVDIL